VENVPPYALKGDVDGNYKSWSYDLGENVLRATPFTSSGGDGDAGASLEITFTIEGSSRLRAPRMHCTRKFKKFQTHGFEAGHEEGNATN
jgi:hypothetical protein